MADTTMLAHQEVVSQVHDAASLWQQPTFSIYRGILGRMLQLPLDISSKLWVVAPDILQQLPLMGLSLLECQQHQVVNCRRLVGIPPA